MPSAAVSVLVEFLRPPPSRHHAAHRCGSSNTSLNSGESFGNRAELTFWAFRTAAQLDSRHITARIRRKCQRLPPIFMLGGAPKTHEVLSKMPRIGARDSRKIFCPRHFRSSLATTRRWPDQSIQARLSVLIRRTTNKFRIARENEAARRRTLRVR
jgi:hypothetical protein